MEPAEGTDSRGLELQMPRVILGMLSLRPQLPCYSTQPGSGFWREGVSVVEHEFPAAHAFRQGHHLAFLLFWTWTPGEEMEQGSLRQVPFEKKYNLEASFFVSSLAASQSFL